MYIYICMYICTYVCVGKEARKENGLTSPFIFIKTEYKQGFIQRGGTGIPPQEFAKNLLF